MRYRFDEQLDTLEESMKAMGSECVNAIVCTSETLMTGNRKKAKEVLSLSIRIHRMERDIESLCLKLLLQQQPVASDLRVISSALKSVYDLERIGDVTGDIATLVLQENVSIASDVLGLKKMAEVTKDMVEEAVEALTLKDTKKAEEVRKKDDIVDDCFSDAKQTLTRLFDGNETGMEYALNLLMIAKYFEKIGDHAVNVADWGYFAATGVLVDKDKEDE